MKYVMWALASLILLAACSNSDGLTGQKNTTASAKLMNLQEYQQENSFAFECNTTGFEPHTFYWDFGDGIKRTTPYKGVAHTYFKSGEYTITCTATDDVVNQTSETTVTVQVEGADDYLPENETMFDDLGLIDLLSDIPEPYLSSNATPNMTISSQRDEEDYSFEFDFDEEEEDAGDTTTEPPNPDGKGTLTNTTAKNTTNTTTNSTNNTTIPNTTLPNSTNTTSISNTSINTTPTTINNTKNDTESRNESDNPQNETQDGKTGTQDNMEVIDQKIETEIGINAGGGKFKKRLITDLKFKGK